MTRIYEIINLRKDKVSTRERIVSYIYLCMEKKKYCMSSGEIRGGLSMLHFPEADARIYRRLQHPRALARRLNLRHHCGKHKNTVRRVRVIGMIHIFSFKLQWKKICIRSKSRDSAARTTECKHSLVLPHYVTAKRSQLCPSVHWKHNCHVWWSLYEKYL